MHSIFAKEREESAMGTETRCLLLTDQCYMITLVFKGDLTAIVKAKKNLKFRRREMKEHQAKSIFCLDI